MLPEANLAVHELLMKTQVDANEATGEVDPVVRLLRGPPQRYSPTLPRPALMAERIPLPSSRLCFEP